MHVETDAASHEFPAVVARAARIAAEVAGLEGAALLEPLLRTEFAGRVAMVSSFGTESAVLLALVAEVDPATPVLFIDTGRLFGETKRYRDQLAAKLGLTDVRTVTPDRQEVLAQDRELMLFQHNPDACCHIRKVLPFERALANFDAWISGRKRYHGSDRAALSVVEADRGWIKLNPLVAWSRDRIESEFKRRGLPSHPLEADGYRSVGCLPCSAPVAEGADLRAGRWAGKTKTECGLHRRAQSFHVGVSAA